MMWINNPISNLWRNIYSVYSDRGSDQGDGSPGRFLVIAASRGDGSPGRFLVAAGTV